MGISSILLMKEIRLTTWDVQNHVNNKISYLSHGAGNSSIQSMYREMLCIGPT